MRHRRPLTACSLALVGVVLAACSSSSSGGSTASSGSTPSSGSSASATHGTYNVLAIVASSGPLAAVTAAEMDGMKDAAAYVNAAGGIDGKTVKVTIKNDNADPTTAANVLQQALSSGTKPDAVYPGTTSTETAAMVPILTQEKMLSIQTAVSDTTIDPSKYPYAFSLASSAGDFAKELASGLKAKYPNVHKIGIIIGNDVTGKSNMANELKALHAAGYTTVVQTYDPTSTVDMTPQMEALKAANPDLVVAGGFGAVAGYILKARTKIGWNVPLVGDASFSSNALPTLTDAAGLKGVSIMTTTPAIYRPISQRDKAFQTLFNKVKPANGQFTAPFNLYGFGWDDIILLRVAATQAKATDTASMVTALENLSDSNDPDFVNGSYKYSSSVHSSVPDLSQATLASPYSKDGQPLPFGKTG